MKNFFRALEHHRVRYLLVSGQASILYGASTFSEDIDLWIEPERFNWQAALRALEQNEARIYKLTPPLQPGYATRGHGFHFTLPDPDTSVEIYLDIMGLMPRVGDFKSCFRRARHFDTDWGKIPVLHPHDLVEIKKTRRLIDYTVISALVRLTCRRTRSFEEWSWGLHHSFEAEDLMILWKEGRPAWKRRLAPKREALKILMDPKTSNLFKNLSQELAMEIEILREKDRQYWQPIIAELKQLQKERKLLKEGLPVRGRA